MSAIDLHQHVWPEALVDALRRRTRTPCLRGWTLHTEGEAPYAVRPDDHDLRRRVELDRRAGIDLACVSLSAPLGIESLPRDEAADLLDAWHSGALALPARYAAWASVPTADPDLDELAALLAGGFIGVQLPASALTTPAAWQEAAGVLHTAELADKPVFVHPGPARAVEDAPSWWAPVVDYVAQLQAAWWGWHAFGGRAQFPQLRVVFAAGAGLAPLQHERLAARGGRVGPVDPDLFVDTSSYDAQAVDALVRALGVDVVALGSDRPYAEPLPPLFGEAATRLIRVDNPLRALRGADVVAPAEAVVA